MGRLRRRGRDERGVAIVEMAIIAPLFLLLLFGIVEFGLAFRKQLIVSNSTQSSGRVAATLGVKEDTDWAVLQSVEQSTSNLGDIVKEVHIWKADGAGNPVGGTCGDNGTATCNVYRFIGVNCGWDPCPDPDVSGGPFLGGGWGYGLNQRDVVLDEDGLDVVGVTIYYSHEWLTGLVPISDQVCADPPTNCWSNSAIFRFEPQLFEAPS